MGNWKHRYPHIPLLLSMKPTVRILLGQKLYWTEKKDGSCITIWLEKIKWKKKLNIADFTGTNGRDNWLIGNEVYRLHISSRYSSSERPMADAIKDLQSQVERSKGFSEVFNLLHENPEFVIYVEACRKGRSITGAELYDQDELYVFDIFNSYTEKFLPYVNVYQHCFHHKIPIVKLWAETRHRSVKDLLKWKNYALKHCKAVKLEGIVIKAYRIPERIRNYYREYSKGLIQAKIKLDIPEPKRRKISKGKPIYPPMPDNEVLGALDKVWQELGNEDFLDTRKAMPLIAKYVGDAKSQHLYTAPTKKLFTYYQEYKERLIT